MTDRPTECDELDAADTAIQFGLRVLEERLAALRLGVSLSRKFKHHDRDHVLRFEKHAGRWRFTVDGVPTEGINRDLRNVAALEAAAMTERLPAQLKAHLDLRHKALAALSNTLAMFPEGQTPGERTNGHAAAEKTKGVVFPEGGQATRLTRGVKNK